MRKLAFGLIGLALLAAGSARAAAPDAGPGAPVRQVILVQNSGWMEPFYEDPRSKFRQLVSSLAAQSNLKGVPVVLATFNQDGQVAGERSPEVKWQGDFEAAEFDGAVQAIRLPRKATGAYADADFNGALKGTISRVLGGGEGVIWMITNNKDSPNNSQDVVANTERFYSLLRTSPHITRIAAFPIRNELAGANFKERGFIVYAFAYGASAGRALDVILAEGSATRALFRSPPVKLKPLATNPVELRLATNSGQVGAAAKVVNGVLNLDKVPGGKPATVKLQGVLHNTYYPQNIDSAALSVRWKSSDPALSAARISITPSAISQVPARGESAPVTLTIELPAAARRGPFFGIFETERRSLAEIEINLKDLQFSLSPDFVERIGAISGGESIREAQAEAMISSQLPAVFLDYKRVSAATTNLPVVIGLKYSPLPLILVLLIVTLLLGGAAFIILWVGRPRTYPVNVGAGGQTVSIRPFESRVVSDGFGMRARVRGSLFGPPTIREMADEAKR